LLILVFNNAKYAAMQYFHDKFYPSGTSIATKDYYGVNIRSVNYEAAAAIVGGYAKRVENPDQLDGALKEALAAIRAGKTAILNVIMPDPGNLR
jgi:acetolactate synthase-1/2/3 large subunit